MDIINFLLAGIFIVLVFIAGVEYGSYQRQKESRLAQMIKEYKK